MWGREKWKLKYIIEMIIYRTNKRTILLSWSEINNESKSQTRRSQVIWSTKTTKRSYIIVQRISSTLSGPFARPVVQHQRWPFLCQHINNRNYSATNSSVPFSTQPRKFVRVRELSTSSGNQSPKWPWKVSNENTNNPQGEMRAKCGRRWRPCTVMMWAWL